MAGLVVLLGTRARVPEVPKLRVRLARTGGPLCRPALFPPPDRRSDIRFFFDSSFFSFPDIRFFCWLARLACFALRTSFALASRARPSSILFFVAGPRPTFFLLCAASEPQRSPPPPPPPSSSSSPHVPPGKSFEFLPARPLPPSWASDHFCCAFAFTLAFLFSSRAPARSGKPRGPPRRSGPRSCFSLPIAWVFAKTAFSVSPPPGGEQKVVTFFCHARVEILRCALLAVLVRLRVRYDSVRCLVRLVTPLQMGKCHGEDPHFYCSRFAGFTCARDGSSHYLPR